MARGSEVLVVDEAAEVAADAEDGDAERRQHERRDRRGGDAALRPA
jgi:hypothetical protein